MSKGRKERQPFNIFWLVVLAAMCVVIVADISRADEISSGQNCAGKSSACLNGGDSVAIGLGSPSFGAAIDQCLSTKSQTWLWGIWGNQDSESNYWCMGAQYRQLGLYDAAARVWCSKAGMNSLYSSHQECMSALSAPPEQPREAPVVAARLDDAVEDLHAAEIEEYQMLVADMQASYENLTAAEPQVVERTVVQEVERFTDDQRVRLAEIKE